MSYPRLGGGGLFVLSVCVLHAGAACSVLVDAQRQQCETNDDCGKHGAAFVGFVCVQSVCVRAGDEGGLGGTSAGGRQGSEGQGGGNSGSSLGGTSAGGRQGSEGQGGGNSGSSLDGSLGGSSGGSLGGSSGSGGGNSTGGSPDGGSSETGSDLMDANVGDLLDACEVMSDTSLGDAMNYDSAVDATANVCPSAGFGKLTVCPYAPIPAANDVYYFTGATHDGNNVNSSSAGSSDGCSNDGFTYVAPDRADQGQTFTTGHSATGYRIAAVWLQHVGYTENTEPGGCGNGTWWAQPAGVVYTLRITDPTHAGSVGFALAAETFTTLGGEGGWPSAAIGDINGDGMWIRFELATPVTVSGSTTYGFDLSVKANAFFEWLGSKDGTLAGGGAYNGNTSGQAGGPDNVMNVLVGDRVFLVQMTTGGGLQQDGSVSEAAQADATDSDVAQAGADP